jgi:uncharacterized protein (TIGR00369 family)
MSYILFCLANSFYKALCSLHLKPDLKSYVRWRKMKETMSFEDKLLILKDIYQNTMPFNRLLDIEVMSLADDDIEVKIDMREQLVGNFVHGMLHGGVISAVLDLTGGLIASVELVKQLGNVANEELARRMARIGTIDLRVDYLRAGKGNYFLASGYTLRHGSKVAVVRTDLRNDQNILIAAGTATYHVG